MKLLFDQNLSRLLVAKLSADYPGSSQALLLGLDRASDIDLWEFAKKEDYTIVTHDIDFHERVHLFGHPPKVIWLRTGNTSTKHIAELLALHKIQINDFGNDTAHGCLEIF